MKTSQSVRLAARCAVLLVSASTLTMLIPGSLGSPIFGPADEPEELHAEVSVPENSEAGKLIFEPGSRPLTAPFRLETARPEGAFQVNPETGRVTLAAECLDFESTTVTEFTLSGVETKPAVEEESAAEDPADAFASAFAESLLDSGLDADEVARLTERRRTIRVRVQVTDVNEPPSIAVIIPPEIRQDAAAGTEILTPSATDPDGQDTLVWSVESVPPGAVTADPNTGTLSIGSLKDLSAANGSLPIVLKVTDSGGLFDQTEFLLPVVHLNSPPEMLSRSTPIRTGSWQDPFEIPLRATDPDADDTLTWSLAENPLGAAVTIDAAAGTLQIDPRRLPASASTQSHTLKVEVHDSTGAAASISLPVTVEAAPATFVMPEEPSDEAGPNDTEPDTASEGPTEVASTDTDSDEEARTDDPESAQDAATPSLMSDFADAVSSPIGMTLLACVAIFGFLAMMVMINRPTLASETESIESRRELLAGPEEDGRPADVRDVRIESEPTAKNDGEQKAEAEHDADYRPGNIEALVNLDDTTTDDDQAPKKGKLGPGNRDLEELLQSASERPALSTDAPSADDTNAAAEAPPSGAEGPSDARRLRASQLAEIFGLDESLLSPLTLSNDSDSAKNKGPQEGADNDNPKLGDGVEEYLNELFPMTAAPENIPEIKEARARAEAERNAAGAEAVRRDGPDASDRTAETADAPTAEQGAPTERRSVSDSTDALVESLFRSNPELRLPQTDALPSEGLSSPGSNLSPAESDNDRQPAIQTAVSSEEADDEADDDDGFGFDDLLPPDERERAVAEEVALRTARTDPLRSSQVLFREVAVRAADRAITRATRRRFRSEILPRKVLIGMLLVLSIAGLLSSLFHIAQFGYFPALLMLGAILCAAELYVCLRRLNMAADEDNDEDDDDDREEEPYNGPERRRSQSTHS